MIVIMAKTAKELVAETMAGRFDPNTEQCLFVSLAKNYCVWKDGIPDIAEVAGALYQIPVETEEEKLAVMDYLNQSMDQYLLEPVPSYDAKEYSKCCRDYGKSWKSCGISIHAYDQACAAFLGRCALYREYSSAAKQDSVLPVHGLDHAYAAAVDHDRKYCSSRNLDARSKAMAGARESVMRRHNREHARDRSWRTRRRADIEAPSLSMTRLAVVGEMPMDNGEYLLKIQVAQDVPNSGISKPGFTTGNPDCFLSMPQANGFKLYTKSQMDQLRRVVNLDGDCPVFRAECSGRPGISDIQINLRTAQTDLVGFDRQRHDLNTKRAKDLWEPKYPSMDILKKDLFEEFASGASQDGPEFS